jgi:integrase
MPFHPYSRPDILRAGQHLALVSSVRGLRQRVDHCETREGRTAGTRRSRLAHLHFRFYGASTCGLERASLPRRRFHDLRHSAASLLIAAGVELVEVSRLLGHSELRVTADLYSHLQQQTAATAARMEAVLRGWWVR